YREGLALLDGEDRVIFWNRAAETMTGYPGAQVLGRHIPAALEGLTSCPVWEGDLQNRGDPRGAMVHAQHMRGHDLPMTARRLVLRDGLGERIGTAAVFHSAEQNSSLNDCAAGSEAAADLQERLEAEYEAWLKGGAPL